MPAARPPVPSVAAKVLLACGGLLFAVAVAEAGLRVAGFSFTLTPIVQVGWPDPQAIQTLYRDDPDLFWVKPDYAQRLEAARANPPDIVFMGDSCTDLGRYPEYTLAGLSAGASHAVTGLVAGTMGWSSEQGLAQLERDILPLHPKVITVYFGWNDHWVALGPTDPQLRSARRLRFLQDHSRLAQLVLKARIGVSGPISERPNRVPADAYRRNLTRIVNLASDAGIKTVLMTAPSNHTAGHEPQYLAARHLRRLEELVPLHRAYQQTTREVAAATGATLCDLASAFDALSGPRRTYFRSDGIHLTDAGDRKIAATLVGCLADAGGPRAIAAR